MRDIGNSPNLLVKSGPQAGALLTLLPGSHRVGKSFDCNIVLADPLLAAAHFALEDASGPNNAPALALRALDAEVRIQGGPVLRSGESYPVRWPLSFTAGGTQFRLELPVNTPASAGPGWQSRVAMLAVLAIGAITFLVVQATPAGTATVADLSAVAPVREHVIAATSPARPVAAELTAALADRLATAGLAGVHPSMNADGVMEAAGTVLPEQQAAWSDVKRWFDGAHGARTVLVDRVALSAPAAPLSIAAVHPGASPFVIDRSGQKLFPGSSLPGGWVVDTIEPTQVLVRRNGQALAVRF